MALLVELRQGNGTTFDGDDKLVLFKSHWNNLIGKPSTYNPAPHDATHDTHNDARYLGKTAKAADSNLLDGLDSTVFIRNDISQYTQNNIYASALYPYANGVPRNNLGTPTIIEAALFDEQFNNKTAFYPINNIKFFTSVDNITWVEYTGFSDDNKRKFVGGDASSGIYIPNTTPYFRIEIASNSYVYLNALYMYWSGSGNTTKVRIQIKRCDNQVWYQHTNSSASVSSWPGHLYLPFSTIPFHPSGTTHYDTIRIDFEPSWNNGNNISLYKLQLWGGYPAGKRVIYDTNEYKDVNFPSQIKEQGQRVYSPNNKPSWADILSKPSIINDVTTGGTTNMLSAEQGKVLKGYIDTINTLLSSDETTLDELQEIVDYIQTNRETLDTLGIANITGLQAALDLKMSTSHPANNHTTTHLYMANGDGFIWDDTNNIMKVRKDGVDYVLWDAGNLTALSQLTNDATFLTSAQIDALLLNKVPTTRTINAKALSANISLNAADVGALDALHAASGVTAAKIGYWDTAYGWGNHSGLYRPVAWVPAWGDVTDKPSTFAPSSHAHGNISNGGAIGSTAGLIVKTGTSGIITTLAAGTTSQFLRGDGTWATPADSTTLAGLGITASAAELNYVNGVTSAIQTQLNAKTVTTLNAGAANSVAYSVSGSTLTITIS